MTRISPKLIVSQSKLCIHNMLGDNGEVTSCIQQLHIRISICFFNLRDSVQTNQNDLNQRECDGGGKREKQAFSKLLSTTTKLEVETSLIVSIYGKSIGLKLQAPTICICAQRNSNFVWYFGIPFYTFIVVLFVVVEHFIFL